MAEWEYLIEPLPGFSIAEAVEDRQLWNSRVKVMDGRAIIDYLPMTEINASRSDLKPPPEYFLLEEVRTTEGLVPIEKTVSENTLVPFLNPFHQIIYTIVSNIGNTRPESIRKGLIDNYRVFPDTEIARDVIDKLIDTMDTRAHILHYVKDGVFYYRRGRPLEADEVHMIDFQRGFDPIAWQILDIIKNYGRVERAEISNFIMLSYGWLTQMTSVDDYLIALEEGELWGKRICSQNGGNIEKIRKNEYLYKFPLDSWG